MDEFKRKRDECGAANRPMQYNDAEFEVLLDWLPQDGLGFLPAIALPCPGWKRVRTERAFAFARAELDWPQQALAEAFGVFGADFDPQDVIDNMKPGNYVAMTSTLEFPVVEISWFVREQR